MQGSVCGQSSNWPIDFGQRFSGRQVPGRLGIRIERKRCDRFCGPLNWPSLSAAASGDLIWWWMILIPIPIPLASILIAIPTHSGWQQVADVATQEAGAY